MFKTKRKIMWKIAPSCRTTNKKSKVHKTSPKLFTYLINISMHVNRSRFMLLYTNKKLQKKPKLYDNISKTEQQLSTK